MTIYDAHVARWKDCRKCLLHKSRVTVVFARGEAPCDALIVGEAPGQSENTLGIPFVGPAGILLDRIVDASQTSPPLRLAFYNLCGCIPLQPDDTKKLGQPPPESIKACRPRLAEFIALARPRLLVMAGALAHRHARFALGDSELHPGDPGTVTGHPTLTLWLNVIHPSGILHKPLAQQGFLIKQTILALASAFQDLRKELDNVI
jgi:uracil-DNA glycosylase family 4